MISWIDDYLAIGDDSDSMKHQALRSAGVDLIVDIRNLFYGDEDEPTLKTKRIAKLLGELSQQGFKILIYCHAGIDRSPFIGMLYLCYKYDIDYAKAYAWVKEKRPQIVEHWEWVEVIG